jgi:predicted amidohydrolase YtcJ
MSETLVYNAKIRSMDPTHPHADWLLIRDGLIAALGLGTPPAVAKQTRQINAHGNLVLPGFQDAHIHLLSGGTERATSAQLYDVPNIESLIAAMVAHAAKRPDMALVTGSGWQAGLFGDHNLTAAVMDRAVADRPALAYDSSFHNACLNSRALAMAGITDDTPDLPNGHILRDGAGRATGMLHEEAIGWATARLPQLDANHLTEGLATGQAHANAHGLTGVLDPKVTAEDAEVYGRAAAAGRLSLRVAGAVQVTEADTPASAVARLSALRAAHHGPDFHIQSAKFFMDGIFENRTAALLADYADQPGNAACMFSADQTNALFTALDAARFAIHVHVIGDAAARRALDGLQAARAANGPWPAQHQLTHLQLTDPADHVRLAQLATANIQPLWAQLDPEIPDIALDMIGPERHPDTYAFRKMLNAGADWCLSSDWSVSTLNPFEIMQTAITRQARMIDQPKPPFYPDQALTIAECVAGYTTHAARAVWRAGYTGQLRPGFSADLIMLDRDIFTCPPQEISATRVLLTLFKGNPVWQA